MKYLKYLLFLILAIVIIFIGMGLLTPSIYYESEVTVDKPAKEAWAVLNDESNMSEWLPGYVKSELISGTPNEVGAVSKIYFNEGGQETVMTETITAIKPNEHIAMDFSIPEFMDMDYEMYMKEEGGKTILSSKTTTEGNGLFAKSMVALMKSQMKSQEDINMVALQKLINENTKDYFPAVVVDSLSVK